MKIRLLLEMSEFYKNWNGSKREFIDFLIYIQQRYFPFYSLPKIYKMLFHKKQDTKLDLKEKLRLLSREELRVLARMIKDKMFEGKATQEDIEILKIIDELLREENASESFKKVIFKILMYLNKISNLTYNDLLEMDIETLEEVLKDGDIQQMAEYTAKLSLI